MYFKLVNFIWFVIVASLVKSSHEYGYGTAENEVKIQNQMKIDIGMLKDNISKLQLDLTVLDFAFDSLTDAIRGVKTKLSHGEKPEAEQCEMEDFFHDIDVKMTKIKQKLQNAINDNDGEHMDKLDMILTNVKRAARDCSSDDNDALVDLQAKITAKLSEFDKYVVRLQQLEEKLTQPPNPAQQANPDLSNILNEINTKLNAQQVKLEKFEAVIPDMQNATQTMEAYMANRKADCTKKKCISKNILKLTMNSATSN